MAKVKSEPAQVIEEAKVTTLPPISPKQGAVEIQWHDSVIGRLMLRLETDDWEASLTPHLTSGSKVVSMMDGYGNTISTLEAYVLP
jgi:hypothetical protein